jgi:hypothetical protein
MCDGFNIIGTFCDFVNKGFWITCSKNILHKHRGDSVENLSEKIIYYFHKCARKYLGMILKKQIGYGQIYIEYLGNKMSFLLWDLWNSMRNEF